MIKKLRKIILNVDVMIETYTSESCGNSPNEYIFTVIYAYIRINGIVI